MVRKFEIIIVGPIAVALNTAWTSSSLTAALDEVKEGKMKISVASRATSVPETTVQHYLKMPILTACCVFTGQWRDPGLLV